MKRLQILLVLLLLVSFGLSSCTDPWEAVNALQAEVMEVHDLSMVKIDAIYQTQKELKSMLEVEGGDSTHLNKTDLETINRAIADLDNADAAMFDWMGQYKAPKPEDYSPETATTYLNEQLISITKVDEEMDAAIQNGEATIQNYAHE